MQTDEDKACYVLATLSGPFGRLQQVSDLMRLSEAAATCAHFQPMIAKPTPKQPVCLTKIEIVVVKKAL